MGFTLLGLVTLGFGTTYPMLLIAAAMMGIGSSICHPESSRIARLASGGAHGLVPTIAD
jgi:MFS transporter, FSR family, fosmidomycin resistance protein